jgi:hypothetical protein
MRASAVIFFIVTTTAATIAGCAHDQSIEERARLACQERGVPAGPQMAECIDETEEAIRRAREYQPPPPRPPAKQR